MRSAPPTLSRALLTPGPLPPLSHLGLTLLRHTVATGLRYALFHLGLPVPEAPPVRAVRLRLYLDGGKLDKLLRGAPGGVEVAAALLDPGGAGALPPGAGKLAAAATLHRARLRLARPPAARLPVRAAATGKARPSSGLDPGEEPWPLFQRELSRMLRRTNDALLAELLAALDRRARRAQGQDLPPTPSRAAAALLAGRSMPLERFGIPDPLAPSWAAQPGTAERARAALAGPIRGDRLRGAFRETYRAALTRLAPLLAAHAAAAVASGFLEKEEDAYFLPLDLQEDLASPAHPTRLRWVEAAVRDNRAEREALLAAPEPADLLHTGLETTADSSTLWDLTPLLPLP